MNRCQPSGRVAVVLVSAVLVAWIVKQARLVDVEVVAVALIVAVTRIEISPHRNHR